MTKYIAIIFATVMLSGCWSMVETYEDINRKQDERQEVK